MYVGKVIVFTEPEYEVMEKLATLPPDLVTDVTIHPTTVKVNVLVEQMVG